MSNSSNRTVLQTAKEQLKHCLCMLQNAATDNEKMAALLLFTHLMKTNPSLTVDSNELFNAVDVKFLVRLLNSSNVPDGCPQFMYKSLALNILSSFIENRILFHPLLVSNLTSIAEVVSTGNTSNETAQMFDDAVKILLVFSRHVDGCENLLKSKCIPVIFKAIIQNPEVDNLFEILLGILLHIPQELLAANPSELPEVFVFFSTQFSENQDLLKFAICDKLLALLSTIAESSLNASCNEIFPPKFKDNIQTGINDILQARCKIEYKYTAIKLARVMIQLFGLHWTLIDAHENTVLDLINAKFLLLTLGIIQTEIRLILESGEINSLSDFIISSYMVIEKIIEFLICDKEQGWSFSNEVIMKIHSSLTEIFDCVIQFLIGLNSQGAVGKTPCFQQPIVIATVRVLCVWLSEETNALTDKIKQVLPILLKWAKMDRTITGDENPPTNNSKSNKILHHLLPPLCHLSADESFCEILIKEDCHVLLADLFKELWQTQQEEKTDYPSQLITLCNVFLNFTVLEVELIKTSEVFGDILECITSVVPKILSSNFTILTAHFGLLGLILFRHRQTSSIPQLTVAQNEFILNTISFLKQVLGAVSTDESNCPEYWNDISELWFLSIQNLVACARTMKAVKKLVLESSWPQEIKIWLKSPKESNSLIEDIKSALLPLVNM